MFRIKASKQKEKKPRILRKLSLDGLLVHNTSPIQIGSNYLCLILENRISVIHSETFTVINVLTYSSNIENARLHEHNGLSFLYVLTDDRIVHCHAVDIDTARLAVVSRRSFHLEEFANDFFLYGDYLLAFHELCAVLYSLSTGGKIAELHGHQLKIEAYEKALLDCQCGEHADAFTDVLDYLDEAVWEANRGKNKGKSKSFEEITAFKNELEKYERKHLMCSVCEHLPQAIRFSPSDFYGKEAWPSLRNVTAAFGVGLRNQEEQWSFSRAEFMEHDGTLLVAIYGELPEIVIYEFPRALLTNCAREKRFVVVYPTNRIKGMATNAWLDESLFKSEEYASSANIATYDCDLFAGDVHELRLLGCSDKRLQFAIYSAIFGYAELSIELNELIAGNLLDSFGEFPLTLTEYESKTEFAALIKVDRREYLAQQNAIIDGETVRAYEGRATYGLGLCVQNGIVYLLTEGNTIALIRGDRVESIQVGSDEPLVGLQVFGEYLYCWGDNAMYIIELNE